MVKNLINKIWYVNNMDRLYGYIISPTQHFKRSYSTYYSSISAQVIVSVKIFFIGNCVYFIDLNFASWTLTHADFRVREQTLSHS